ncbi:alpha/beta fold hydrolase [Microbulbifer taiwanensis]|uniref:Alpha/beta fold hydrolase n=1 Tax=Microbulbifer taiwanensis TaxID=986746 RepID=A0ABW1YIC4_9GAMM|nr:alpha/beta hydrolase [Microbulbifer taiwanensis]
MPKTPINGVDLYYECHGKGQPLMLVAGLASDSQSWLPMLEALSRHHLVIVPDNRGAGRTVPQDCENSIRHMADDCMALLDHLQLPSATLLGHSMGGFVAQDCAIRYPARVPRLILAATAPCNSERNNMLFRDWARYLKSGMDPEQWFRNLYYWILSGHFFEDRETLKGALRFALDYPCPQSETAFEKQVEAIAAFDCRDRLEDIQAVTLIICGKEDLLFPPEVSIRDFQAIGNSSISVIEDVAHSIPMESPGALADCILQFLDDD